MRRGRLRRRNGIFAATFCMRPGCDGMHAVPRRGGSWRWKSPNAEAPLPVWMPEVFWSHLRVRAIDTDVREISKEMSQSATQVQSGKRGWSIPVARAKIFRHTGRASPGVRHCARLSRRGKESDLASSKAPVDSPHGCAKSPGRSVKNRQASPSVGRDTERFKPVFCSGAMRTD